MKKETKLKTKRTLKDILSGFLMGIAAAIPGVSGGTMAVLTGVYDRHLDHMNNLRKRFFRNLLLLTPLLIGLVLGLVLALIFFNEAFEGFVFGIVSLFAGFIIGGMPGLTDEIKNQPVKTKYIIIGIIALLVAVGFGVASMLLGENTSLLTAFNMLDDGTWINGGHVAWWLYLLLIPMGVITAIALIVPGISGSLILLVSGFYTPILKTIDWIKALLTEGFNVEQFFSLAGIYICLVIGVVIGFFTVVKLMKILFDKHKTAAYYAVIGFVIGSFISLYINGDMMAYYKNWSTNEHSTWMPMIPEIITGFTLFIIGGAGSYFLVRYSRKQKKLEEK